MGIAGEAQPQFVEPTAVGYGQRGQGPQGPLADLDYAIGGEALASPAYAVCYPMKHGVVDDWDAWEKLMAACIYKCARRGAGGASLARSALPPGPQCPPGWPRRAPHRTLPLPQAPGCVPRGPQLSSHRATAQPS
jgi:hypothetical protein